MRVKIASVIPFRRRAPVRRVEFDPEVFIRSTGVVTGRQDDTAVGLVLADDAGGRRRGKQAALSDDDLGYAVGGRHADDDLDGLTVVITTITTQDQTAALEVRLGVEDRLDKVFQIVPGLKNPDLFAQPGGARSLICEGLGGNGRNLHDDLPSYVVEDGPIQP